MLDAMPAAYAIAHLRTPQINDDVLDYLERIQATLDPFGGRFLVHGGKVEVKEGPWPGTIVVIEFPTHDDSQAWYVVGRPTKRSSPCARGTSRARRSSRMAWTPATTRRTPQPPSVPRWPSGSAPTVAVIDVVRTSDAPADLLAACHRLVLDAFDDGFGADDWEHALGGLHVVATDGQVVVAHAAVVPRTLDVGGQELLAGYVEAVATDRARRGESLGSEVMARVGEIVRAEFEIGALSTGVHHFYERLGWLRWQGPTFVRRGERVVRTPDEDDGVMALITGTSTSNLHCPDHLRGTSRRRLVSLHSVRNAPGR